MTLRRLAHDTAWRMALGGAFFATVYLNPTSMALVPPEAAVGPVVAPADHETAAQLRRHQCWLGEAPVPETLPGGVVIRRASGRVDYSREMVGPALDAALGGWGLEVRRTRVLQVTRQDRQEE